MAEGAQMLGRASKYPERVPGRASRVVRLGRASLVGGRLDRAGFRGN